MDLQNFVCAEVSFPKKCRKAFDLSAISLQAGGNLQVTGAFANFALFTFSADS